MKRKILLAIVILGLGFIYADSAMAYTANGDLSDWGVNPGTSDWVPNPGVFYTEEDLVGPGGQVYPGWGGQTFDAEALYLDWDDTNLYLALVTGFPNTGVGSYSAGDIAIDFGANGTYEYGIEIGGHGSGYGGYSGTLGHVYKGITWQTSASWGGVSNPLYMSSATTDAGIAGFAYNNSFYSSLDPNYNHWVVEMSIPKSFFNGDWNNYMRVHWTQNCGNDNINLTTPVPEPMSLSLLGLSLLGMIGAGIKRKK